MEYRELTEILGAYPAQGRFLLPILQDIQENFRYLPKDHLREVARYLDVPESRVFAVATFYKTLSLDPRGRKSIKVCLGTACHLKGAGKILERFEKELDIEAGTTTSDGSFSLETVNCLGACALAPVIMIEEKVYGQVTPDRIPEILAEERSHAPVL
jgi:NADH-quinone oxidoreductase subunit E